MISVFTSRKQVALFHVVVIAPLLIYAAQTRDSRALDLLMVLGMLSLVYHGYNLVAELRSG